MDKPKVTGIGGIFFKCQDPDKTREWYAQHLGFKTDEYGSTFTWRKNENPEKTGYTQWSTFSADTKYMQPSEQPFMVNYRVNDLLGLLENLKAEGVQIIGEVQEFDYGKFAHIMDPEGNKIELWEPVDEVFDEYHAKKEEDKS